MEQMVFYGADVNVRLVEQVCEGLRGGGIMVYSAEDEHYACCDIWSTGGVERICRMCGSKAEKAGIILGCADIAQMSEYVRIDNDTFKAIKGGDSDPYELQVTGKLPKLLKSCKAMPAAVPHSAIIRAVAEMMGRPIGVVGVSDDEEGDYVIIEE